SSGAERRRFEREARASSALNHPNILTIHDIEQVDDHRFLVSEFIDGETLRDRLGRGRLPVSEAMDIAIQIASALEAAHAAGIVHRDIKPENIMLRRDNLVKVLDFGLAKVSEAVTTSTMPDQATVEWFHTDSGIVLGTSAYMSPEQTRGLPIDGRTDIWSLGVVFYEMVSGSQPLNGATQSDVLVSILQKEPPRLASEITNHRAALKRIFDKALQKDREQRYQSATELLEDLKRLRQETQTSVTNLSTARSLAFSTFNGRGLKFVLFAAMVIVAGLAWYKLSRPSTVQPVRPVPKVTPFTTFSGREQQPTFSPDGNQIAYSATGDKGDNFDIYVKLVNSEATPLRLTSNPADDIYPAWSPDGKLIAFVRHVGAQLGIYTISPLGGTERQLYSGTSALLSFYEFGNALCWSPDGKYLAFSGQPTTDEPNSIFLLSTDTLEAHKITQ